MEMFNPQETRNRIGEMVKSPTLNHLKDCERHFKVGEKVQN